MVKVDVLNSKNKRIKFDQVDFYYFLLKKTLIIILAKKNSFTRMIATDFT